MTSVIAHSVIAHLYKHVRVTNDNRLPYPHTSVSMGSKRRVTPHSYKHVRVTNNN